MRLGGEWISKIAAQIGLLHVIPISADGTAIRNEVKQPHYLLLERTSQQLRDAGVKNDVVFRVRQGMVVDEVLKELLEGGYDLLVVGSHYQPGQNPWQGTLLDDITDQLLNRSACSVLII